ncbi:MFS transporter [Dialister sp.]|uniref:MFS transporter n=1 Tax=Dialister sp. TaxID=1955814 RepID=UPI002E7FB539|nr:MFS transporter [Dialister sp.]MEE3452438.1 MFS transporter [Dialister sp.]
MPVHDVKSGVIESAFSVGNFADQVGGRISPLPPGNPFRYGRHKKEKGRLRRGKARNDWKSFGKLTVLIFARSIGFTVCKTFLPVFWIQVLHADASEGSFILTILFSLGCIITYFGGLLADRLGCVRMLRIAFISMIPAMFLLIHTENTLLAMILLLPASFALFAPFSASVVLGQKYLGKNVAFDSGITLGLSTTFGGLVTPLIGRAADTFGLVPALQILWAVSVPGAIFSFTLKSEKKEEKTGRISQPGLAGEKL